MVTLSTRIYRSNHGAMPRGRGNWAFVMGKEDYVTVDERDAAGRLVVWWAPNQFTFADAARLARAEAKMRGCSLVGVCS